MNGPTIGAQASTPARFGDDMPRVDPGNAGNSYLVYKLLVNARNHPESGEDEGVPDPWLGGMSPAGPPSLDELSRLRSWFVRGDPMPIDGRLVPGEMRAIVRWVLQGAHMPACSIEAP